MTPEHTWYPLDRLGMPGWEHTWAEWTSPKTVGPLVEPPRRCCWVRMRGSELPELIEDAGQGMFRAILGHVTGVEALVRARARDAEAGGG